MYADPEEFDTPQWSGQARQRLLVSLAMSTLCITTVLMVLKIPVVEQAKPFSELLLQILIEDIESVLQADSMESVTEPAEEQAAPALAAGTVEPPARDRDWHAAVPAAVAAALDDPPKDYSVNPVFEEKRRRAAERFYRGEAPRAKPIWENVEKDALGRSLLWSGDCYRVIDDPNAGSREAFETFGQYITYCMNWKDSPKALPWVNEIRNRRASQARYAPPAAE